MVQVYHLGMGVHICRPQEGDVFLMKYSVETLDLVWPTIAPWLGKTLAEAPPWWTLEDLYERCKNGNLIVWIACKDKKPLGVLLTGIDKYKNTSVCGVPWIGGNKMLLWIKTAQEIIEQWAKEAGCTFLTGSGRAGWSRIVGMKDYGPTLIKKL
jgi:hypothetical protein